jgi:hypothetical protein
VKNHGATLSRPSFLRRIVTSSRARDVTRLFDSHAEFAESAVAFFVGRVEAEDILRAQLFREVVKSPVEFFQRKVVSLFVMPRTIFAKRKFRFENFAAGLSGQRFESAFGGQVA